MATSAHRIGRKRANLTLATALASGATLEEASLQAGVSVATVTRRLKDPAFQQQVAQIRSGMLERACGQLADAATAAVATLVELLREGRESTRLAAAREILTHMLKVEELVDFERRIAALEAAQPTQNGRAKP